MKGNGNKIFGESEKTLIFIHKESSFTIDKSVMEEAVYIKLAKEEWKESGESILYYYREMKAAAKSKKKYLIMEYEYINAFMIEELLKRLGNTIFSNGSFTSSFMLTLALKGRNQIQCITPAMKNWPCYGSCSVSHSFLSTLYQ